MRRPVGNLIFGCVALFWPAAAVLPLESRPAGETGVAPPAQDWPMFRGNPRLTGVAASPLPEKLKLLWSVGVGEAVESSAAIRGRTAYVGTMDGFLCALDLKDGRQKWRYRTGAPIKSSPCVVAGLVVAGDEDGVLHAVAAGNGKSRWTFHAEGALTSSPIPVGGRIVVGSYDNALYCLRAADGKLLWKSVTENFVNCAPAVSEDKVLIAGCDQLLRVIELSNGHQVGKVDLGGPCGASAAIVGPQAYVGTFGNEVLGIDWKGLRVAWRYAPSVRKQPFYSSAAVSGDRVVLGGRDKRVHCIDRRRGRPLWTFATRGQVDSSPVIIGDRVFVGSNDGSVYGLDLNSGKLRWRYRAGGRISASPAVGQGVLVIGSEDGMVYCFGKSE